ncbi:MAG: rhomboid family intramembrane serine protease [Thermoanaerobaculia bacterium]|nr:rhomboid family intramembrane serine protease [Thermoanaerobaculia bacterium]
MFPLRDDNPTRRAPVVTGLLITLNLLAWLLLQRAGSGPDFVQSLCSFGAIPADVVGALGRGDLLRLGESVVCEAGGLGWTAILTSMFLHGGWMHLLGNMWFLWIFGNNIEDSMGAGRFVVFYLACGVAAALAHIVTDPASVVPMVGASGAISGVMGAYLVLYPRVRVDTLFILFVYVRVFSLPAWVVLVEWFAIQLFSGIGTLGGPGAGVAFWAHVGGFVAGLALIRLFVRPELVRARRGAPRERPRRPPWA